MGGHWGAELWLLAEGPAPGSDPVRPLGAYGEESLSGPSEPNITHVADSLGREEEGQGSVDWCWCGLCQVHACACT